ncbi:MAG: hydroxymethylbilane synthase [Planctomycetes bacterium]|nr:hydroxymethylbilane synthase [Planctomycetota bacterium]
MRRSSVKVGTRGSALALTQTQQVISKLSAIHPNVRFVPVIIRTTGDRIKSVAELRKAGKGLFVKELELALLKRKIDCAVHSLKDLPSEIPEGLDLGAVLERAEAADVLVGKTALPLEKLPAGAVIGTASLRRQALLRATYPHLRFEDLRGNLDTRLQKLHHPKSRMAAIVVAAAGLRRLLGESAPSHQVIPKDVLVPAPGQGALAIEIRGKDDEMRKLLEPVHHPPTAAAVAAERALQHRLEGGCQVPLGIYAEANDEGLVRLVAALAAPDGSELIREEATGSADDPESLAIALETIMRSRGATDILQALRQDVRKPKATTNGGRGRRRARRASRARR